MDDLFPEQLDFEIEATCDDPRRERLHMVLLEARSRLAELAELREVAADPRGDLARWAEWARPRAPGLCRLLGELAELRGAVTGAYTLGAVWRDGEQLPDSVHLSDGDGDGPDIEIDAACLLEEVRRRQAQSWCRAVDGAEGLLLEQLSEDERCELLVSCPNCLGLAAFRRDCSLCGGQGTMTESLASKLAKLIAEHSCRDQLPGVAIAGNVVSSRGDES